MVNLRKTKAAVTPTSIQGASVEVVEEYKHLALDLDNKVDCGKKVKEVYRKGQSSLLPELAEVLQHLDVLPVCAGQWNQVHSCFLGQQPQ